jgi:hypothetical protein
MFQFCVDLIMKKIVRNSSEVKQKARIIERTSPDGRISYVIQQRHFLFRWQWVDAWTNSLLGAACQDSFPTLKMAKQNLCYFDGTPTTEKMVE